MDYVLNISSFAGLAPGAKHFRGRVVGKRPGSCHGGTVYNAPESRGKTTCSEGHVIPDRVEWSVEDFWTEARHERYAAGHYEGDGPEQFLVEATLIEVAVRRFKDEGDTHWWEGGYPRPVAGDRLFLRYLPDDLAPEDVDEHHGRLLAEIPGEK